MAEIRLTAIKKNFGKSLIVKNMDLLIEDGEFLVIVGPSGCGKTTTLRMIAGLEDPDEGDIFIDDRKITHLEPKDRDVAMVFQNYALYPHMTVAENIAFGLRLQKVAKQTIQERLQKVAAMLGLEQYFSAYPRELSGGQCQRVALGRAIVREPQVFLMDEPLSNLDAKLRTRMRSELIKLHQRLKTTIVYVTHDQTEAMTMGSRIAIMKDGIIQQLGSPTALYHNPVNLFVADFLGSPPMNFLKSHISIEQDQLLFHSEKQKIVLKQLTMLRGQQTPKNIILGIRPEHISLCSSPKGIKGTIQIVEHLGSEILLYTLLPETEQEIIVRWPTHLEPPPIGTPVHLLFDPNNIHLFDAITEENLDLIRDRPKIENSPLRRCTHAG